MDGPTRRGVVRCSGAAAPACPSNGKSQRHHALQVQWTGLQVRGAVYLAVQVMLLSRCSANRARHGRRRKPIKREACNKALDVPTTTDR